MATDRSIDKFKYRGSAFARCFANHFCTVVDRYTKTIAHGRKDKDPPSDLVNGLGWVIGGGVVATAGKLLSAAGLPIASGTAARVGGQAGSMGANFLYNKFVYAKKAETVVRFVEKGTSQQLEYFDSAKQRRLLVHVLVEAALRIFEIFEYQFMAISEADILRSIEKLAYDAACRSVNFIIEQSSDDEMFGASVLVKGVVLGASKKSKSAKVTASLLGQEGDTVTTDAGNEWNTAKLFGKAAVRAENCVYAKGSFNESMGGRLPADLPDFEPCETDTQLQLWLRRNGFAKHEWKMDGEFIKMASDELLTEIGVQVIQRFEANDLELRLDNIDQRLNELKIGISETNAIVSSKVPLKKISFKPISEPHAAFTGRDNFVDSVVTDLTSELNPAAVQIRFPCLVIHALGGYGKTQTARKIASECRRDGKFQHFIWIDSEDDTSTGKCFFEVIQQAGLASYDAVFDSAKIGLLVHKFYDLIADRTDERFLIIFDNVENFDQILDYLPLNYAAANISILMTSQRQCQIQESYGAVRNLPLDLILPDEAIELVEKILGKSDPEEDKKFLVEQSGRIPLVLHVMASTIKFQRKYKSNYRIDQYLNEITHEPLQYSDRTNVLDLSYKKSLREIVRFAIAKLNAIAAPVEQLAVKLFDRVVYCSPSGNTISHFVKIYLQDIQKEANNMDLPLPVKIGGLQIIQMAIDLLSEFSLVQLNGLRFAVHRLIQASRRLDLKDSGNEKDVLYKLISNSPSVSQGQMEDSENALPIWFHVADYADLTNRFYPDKGTLIEFTRYGAVDVVKKIIEIFGLARSVKNIIGDYKYDFYKHCPNPLEIAIKNGNRELIELYTETIRTFKTHDPEQFASWHHEIRKMIEALIRNSSLDVLKQFVEALNLDTKSKSDDLIRAAVDANKLNVIEWLINEQSCRPQKGHLKASVKKSEIFKFILNALDESEPEIDLTNVVEEHSGNNLLICLLRCGGPHASRDVLQILLDRGLNPGAKDDHGWNGLHYAAWENNVTAIDMILSKHPELIDSKNENGWTPLIFAARSGAREATTHFLEKYAVDIDAMDTYGDTALRHAIYLFRLPVVKILLSHGAKTSTTAASGKAMYALHRLVDFLSNNDGFESVEIAKAILAADDCDVNATDAGGNNVLHLLVNRYYASKSEPNHNILELLLSANPVLINVRNNDGLTPTQLAENLITTFPKDYWQAEGLKKFILRLEELCKDRENVS